MSKLLEIPFIFILGGLGYAAIEILWRGRTHWTMMLAGGLCLLFLFNIYSSFKNLNIISKALIGAAVITVVEFIFGYIFNCRLNMNIWDYSDKKFNVMGQICPLYTMLWGMLSIPVSKMCDVLTNWFA